MRRHSILTLPLWFVAACGGGDDKPADSASTPAAATAQVPGAAASDVCPRTGHWSECQVKRRLEQSGLAPRDSKDAVGELPTLDVKPVTLTIGTAKAALYIFADTVARRRVTSALDTMKFIPQGKPVGIRREGTVIQNDNLLLLLFSLNDHQRERVSDAITAGPPQP